MLGSARQLFWKRARLGAAGCAAVLGLAYLALPYVTLYRFDEALRQGDVAWINQHVDWRRLRHSFGDAALPVDHRSTPNPARALARLGGRIGDGVFHAEPTRAATPQAARVGWAYFNGPASFIAHLTMSSRSGPRDVKVVFRFDGAGWRVVRLDAPAELLRGAGPAQRT